MFIKFLDKNGRSPYANFKWPLPKKFLWWWIPGKWTEKIKGNLVFCSKGYHFTNEKMAAQWIDDKMYEIEVNGDYDFDEEYGKYVCRQARLLREIEAYNKIDWNNIKNEITKDFMKYFDKKQYSNSTYNSFYEHLRNLKTGHDISSLINYLNYCEGSNKEKSLKIYQKYSKLFLQELKKVIKV
jgi:hypothetical protein